MFTRVVWKHQERKLKDWKGKCQFISFEKRLSKNKSEVYFSLFLALNCSFSVCVRRKKEFRVLIYNLISCAFPSCSSFKSIFDPERKRDLKRIFSALDFFPFTFHEPPQSGLFVYVNIKVVRPDNLSQKVICINNQSYITSSCVCDKTSKYFAHGWTYGSCSSMKIKRWQVEDKGLVEHAFKRNAYHYFWITEKI